MCGVKVVPAAPVSPFAPCIVPSATFADAEKQADAWALIYRAVTAANKITFYAKAKPTVSIPLQIRCIRK